MTSLSTRSVSPLAPLTPRQERFALAYTSNGGNATEAYKVAYTVDGSNITTINANASRVLSDSKVSARIHEIYDARAITVDRIAQEYHRLAFYTMDDFFSWDGNELVLKDSKDIPPGAMAAIQEISQIQTKGGPRLRIKLASKQAALDSLAKWRGMFIQRIQVESWNVNLDVAEAMKEFSLDEIRQLVGREPLALPPGEPEEDQLDGGSQNPEAQIPT